MIITLNTDNFGTLATNLNELGLEQTNSLLYFLENSVDTIALILIKRGYLLHILTNLHWKTDFYSVQRYLEQELRKVIIERKRGSEIRASILVNLLEQNERGNLGSMLMPIEFELNKHREELTSPSVDNFCSTLS
jgi:hypothetical protein